jgi:hypothetical protein
MPSSLSEGQAVERAGSKMILHFTTVVARVRFFDSHPQLITASEFPAARVR